MSARRWFLGPALASVLLAPAALAADLNQQNAFAAWKTGDSCAQEAFKKYPDYTPEGNAKREEARRVCLRTHHLPAPDAAASAVPPEGGDKP